MHNEFCPKCGTIQNVQTSVTISPSKSKNDQDLKMIRAYHCETCGTFIRSEEVGIGEGGHKL